MENHLSDLPAKERDFILGFSTVVRELCADRRWEDVEPILAETWVRMHKGVGLLWEQVSDSVRKSCDGLIG